MNRVFLHRLLTVYALICMPAIAYSADCVHIGDDQKRLACYDLEAGRAAAGKPAAPSAPASAPEPTESLTPPNPAAPASPVGRNQPSSIFSERPQSTDQPAKLPGPLGDAARQERDARRMAGSSLTDRWELDPDSERGRFLLRPYKPMYVILGDWTSNANTTPTSPNPNNTVHTALPLQKVEAKFQISLKSKVWEDIFGNNGDLWLGYTQTSFWQIYNSAGSRPFRESDYEPEAMLVFRTNYSLLGWQGKMAGISLNHQSNGRDEPLSRSWNRIIAQVGLEKGNWMTVIRPWWRLPEAGRTDDNPDIQDYYGRFDWLVVHREAGHELSLLMRHSLRFGERSHGSAEINYAFPISSYLKGYVQLFSGYGASLIDYNHRQTRIGVGVSLVQWL